jgi:hypothetical protein
MRIQLLITTWFFAALSVARGPLAPRPVPALDDRITISVTDAQSGLPVVQPMVCIREFGQSHGPIGDSTGKVVIAGNLPRGTLHLRVLAPRHFPLDTIAAWPSTTSGGEMRLRLRPRSGSPTVPECD